MNSPIKCPKCNKIFFPQDRQEYCPFCRKPLFVMDEETLKNMKDLFGLNNPLGGK